MEIKTEINPGTLSWETFLSVDIRVGTIVACKEFKEARKPAYQVWVDFGDDLGHKKSSAQITHLYTCNDLLGKQVLAVVNFPEKQIGSFLSEILILGLHNAQGSVSLVSPDHLIPNGTKLL